MTWMRAFSRFVLLTAMLVVSAVGLMIDFPSFGGLFDKVRETGKAIKEVWVWRTHGLFTLWAALFALSLVHLLLVFMTRKKRVHVEVETGDGRVCILDSAIRKFVQTVLAKIPGVTVRRVDIRSERRGLKIDIYALVRAQDGLGRIKEDMIEKVKLALTEQMGIPSVAGVDVFIEDFEVRQKGAIKEAPISEPEPVTRSVPPSRPVSVYPADDALSSSPFLAPKGKGESSMATESPEVIRMDTDFDPPPADSAENGGDSGKTTPAA